jgi:hypothetical protein
MTVKDTIMNLGTPLYIDWIASEPNLNKPLRGVEGIVSQRFLDHNFALANCEVARRELVVRTLYYV